MRISIITSALLAFSAPALAEQSEKPAAKTNRSCNLPFGYIQHGYAACQLCASGPPPTYNMLFCDDGTAWRASTCSYGQGNQCPANPPKPMCNPRPDKPTWMMELNETACYPTGTPNPGEPYEYFQFTCAGPQYVTGPKELRSAAYCRQRGWKVHNIN